MKAIDMLRISVHGPPKELITDGETGIATYQRTGEHLPRLGAHTRQRPTCQIRRETWSFTPRHHSQS